VHRLRQVLVVIAVAAALVLPAGVAQAALPSGCAFTGGAVAVARTGIAHTVHIYAPPMACTPTPPHSYAITTTYRLERYYVSTHTWSTEYSWVTHKKDASNGVNGTLHCVTTGALMRFAATWRWWDSAVKAYIQTSTVTSSTTALCS
jgi:hypothetical protein